LIACIASITHLTSATASPAKQINTAHNKINTAHNKINTAHNKINTAHNKINTAHNKIKLTIVKPHLPTIANPHLPRNAVSRGFYNVFADYSNYYSWPNLELIGYAVLGSAVFANTGLDESLNNSYQKNFVNNSTNKFAAFVKHPGNNSSILVYAGGSILGAALQKINVGNTFFNWSSRTLRSVLVGAPPVLLLQRVIGTARPNHGSQWRPFYQDHAVSGHAFLGSLPFITAAQMTNYLPLKILLYTGSTFTGWSRLNDNEHYFSQILFGWWMGYLAVSSVSNSESEPRWEIMPYSEANGLTGMMASISL
jgi:membrane-associated phospholipid phosphatase